MERTRHYQTATRDALTPRQREVLDLIARGKTNGEIAEQLGITLDGAKFHVREILAKLGVDSREEAAAWWRRENGMQKRLQRLAVWLIPGGLLKPLSMAAALAGTLAAAGIVAGALLLSGGGGELEAAGAQNPGNCDPNIVKWRTEAELDADGVMQFTVTAASFECQLDTDVTLHAYGMTDEGAGTGLWAVAPPVELHAGPLKLGNFETDVLRGTISNVCNRSDRILLIIDHPYPEQFMIDRVHSPRCNDADSPSSFSAQAAD